MSILFFEIISNFTFLAKNNNFCVVFLVTDNIADQGHELMMMIIVIVIAADPAVMMMMATTTCIG